MCAAALPPVPDERQMDRLTQILAPFARVTQPKLYGLERVPNGGALWVGNHTRWAFLDLPFMMGELWTRRQIVVRGLGDHGHYAIPVWRDLLTMSGMVRGTRENVRALMAEGQHVLVFPGGANEVFKGRGQDYRLLWKERLGFARLAIDCGYPIVPFAAVGAEEMLDVVIDRDMPVAAQISTLMKRLVGVPLPPLPRGVGPTALPRPERLYFWFGEPLDTTRYEGRADDAAARGLRDTVKAAVQQGIVRMRTERDRDPKRGLLPRLASRDQDELPQTATEDPSAWMVTRAFEAWNEDGAGGAAAWISRRAALRDPPGWPGGDTWRGRDAVLRRLDEMAEQLHAETVEVRQARSLDGDRVLADFVVCRAAGSGGHAAFSAILTLHGDQITAMRVFTDHDQARRAAKPDARVAA